MMHPEVVAGIALPSSVIQDVLIGENHGGGLSFDTLCETLS